MRIHYLYCVLLIFFISCPTLKASTTTTYEEHHFFNTTGTQVGPYIDSTDPEVAAIRDSTTNNVLIINYKDVYEVNRKDFIPVLDKTYKGTSTVYINLAYFAPLLGITYTPDVEAQTFILTGKNYRTNQDISVSGKVGTTYVMNGPDKIFMDPIHPGLRTKLVDSNFYVPIILLYQAFGYYVSFNNLTPYWEDNFQRARFFISDLNAYTLPPSTHYKDYPNPVIALTEGMMQFKPYTISESFAGVDFARHDDATVTFFGKAYSGLQISSCQWDETARKNGQVAEIVMPSYNSLWYGSFLDYEDDYRAQRTKDIFFFYLGEAEGLDAFYKLNDYFLGITKDFTPLVYPSGYKIKIEKNSFPIIQIYKN